MFEARLPIMKRYLLLLLLLISTAVLAQEKKFPDSPKNVSTPVSFMEKMQAVAKNAAKTSSDDFSADKAIIEQTKILGEVKKNVQVARIYLKTTNDTATTVAIISNIERDLTHAGDGVITNKGTAQTFRNLTATSKILTELYSKANNRKNALDARQTQLNLFRYQLDSLLSLPALFKFSKASVILLKYIEQLKVINYDVSPVDSMLKKAATVNQIQLNRINVLVFKLQSSLDEISTYQQEIAKNSFKKEFANIWEPVEYHRPFGEIAHQAYIKGKLTLLFYLENNIGKLIILILLITSSFLYLRSLKSIYKENNLLSADFEGQLVLRYPFFSALFLMINLGQFIFLSPPFILNVIFWTLSCMSLTVMFQKFITKYWMNVWLAMVILFLITAGDNLILQASRVERWLMLLVAVFGAIIGIFALIKGKRQELREKLIIVSITLMVILEIASALTNVFGIYNLSKSLLIGGYTNVVVAILFLWTVRLINEGLYLAFSVYKQPDKKLFYLNFDKVGKRIPPFFYAIPIFAWIIVFGRNFAGFDYFSTPIIDFFISKRTLGNYTFSISGLLLFFAIMAIAVITSKIVSFFASDRHLAHDRSDAATNQGIGSWLLLIRITILSVGLFLAIAAAGIPMDRITIVIGALGVGIGFGLQTMVNNLVSGLIIAFEKPVNVGDIVDINGQTGTMKSVGFRSSVITTWDGADLVMPNGDLLNAQLINWSLGGNRRRVAIDISVAYDTDLELVKQLLLDKLAENEKVLKKPNPVVRYEQFGSSAINLKVLFWTRDFREALSIKSDVIVDITTLFREHKITIPFPQQDVHLLDTQIITGKNDDET